MIERDEQHRYWQTDKHGREEYIGVTRTLIASNLIDDTYFTDLARGKGKLVHYFAERIATNQSLEIGIADHVVGYLIGLRKALDKFSPIVKGAEIMKGDSTRKLAGTLDIDVVMMGGPGVIEVKTSTPTAWHGLQLAPYCYLLDKTKWLKRARWGLYLNDRGGFRLKEYTDYTDLDTFFRAHELLTWRIQHGSHERPYGRTIDLGRNDSGVFSVEAGEWGNREDGNFTAFDAGSSEESIR